jgi:hypothetical protein
MNKIIKNKWVKALRSGRYKQCQDYLCNGAGYCCLGILARISGCSKHKLVEDTINTDYRKDQNGDQLLSSKFLREVGMKKETQLNLALMNDEQKSFEEIADYIEKRL